MRRVWPWGALVWLLVVSCEQPTTDPDQAIRDLLIGPTWIQDDANYPTEPGDTFRFATDGSLNKGGADNWGRWSYKSGTLTLTYTDGGSTVTETSSGANLAVTGSTLRLIFLGVTCHFVTTL